MKEVLLRCSYLIETNSIDVVEEMREQLYSECGVDATPAQEYDGGR